MHYLKYTTSSFNSINNNPKHRFAQNHALNIYRHNAIYSYIPKNACSTMRLSIAMANGAIKDKKDFNWIHNNNGAFSADMRDLVQCKYAFTILRDPFSRLVSVFLDKFINRDVVAWKYIALHNRAINLDDVTFEFFIKSLENPTIRNGNIHWKPQEDFLVFEDYDDYFAFEEFQKIRVKLKNKIDLDIVDARPLVDHHTSGYKVLEGDSLFKVNPIELLNKKLSGYLPSPESMFSKEMIEIVNKVYINDIELYNSKISNSLITLKDKL
ncbi:MAG: sulfotransferase family 2 domain-containing protein [Candidatus Cloacimonetes bacterium]|nr:sulfotransferase family 2 domain-containing protein [Candidatus Cloacimonadota bacterium]